MTARAPHSYLGPHQRSSHQHSVVMAGIVPHPVIINPGHRVDQRFTNQTLWTRKETVSFRRQRRLPVLPQAPTLWLLMDHAGTGWGHTTPQQVNLEPCGLARLWAHGLALLLLTWPLVPTAMVSGHDLQSSAGVNMGRTGGVVWENWTVPRDPEAEADPKQSRPGAAAEAAR